MTERKIGIKKVYEKLAREDREKKEGIKWERIRIRLNERTNDQYLDFRTRTVTHSQNECYLRHCLLTIGMFNPVIRHVQSLMVLVWGEFRL